MDADVKLQFRRIESEHEEVLFFFDEIFNFLLDDNFTTWPSVWLGKIFNVKYRVLLPI